MSPQRNVPPGKRGVSPQRAGECPLTERGSVPLAKCPLSQRGVSPQRAGMSPQHGGGAGGIPRSGGEIGCSAAISTFRRGTDRAFSPAGGDDPQTTESGGPGRPRPRGDRPRWSGAAFHTVLCLTRLQSRSDARLGSGVRMQQPC